MKFPFGGKVTDCLDHRIRMFVTLWATLLFCVRGGNAYSGSPKILQSSECKVQLNVLTCVCITEGFPLPTITWPLLKNRAEYSVMTTVSHHTVNSIMTLTMKDHSNTTVECVSTNGNDEAIENLVIQTNRSDLMDQFTEALKMVSWLQVVIAFLIGVFLSTVICCFIRNCHGKNKKKFVNPDETVEMINADQAVEEPQTYSQETAEEGGRAGSEEKAALDPNGVPEDLHYASIDFSVLSPEERNSPANTPEHTETEYTEIK